MAQVDAATSRSEQSALSLSADQSNEPEGARTMVSARIHEAYLKMMKELLCLGELAFGRETNAYRHYKKSMMNEVSELGREINRLLADSGVSVPCDCGASLDEGPRWTRCPHCAGSGFKDAHGDHAEVGKE